MHDLYDKRRKMTNGKETFFFQNGEQKKINLKPWIRSVDNITVTAWIWTAIKMHSTFAWKYKNQIKWNLILVSAFWELSFSFYDRCRQLENIQCCFCCYCFEWCLPFCVYAILSAYHLGKKNMAAENIVWILSWYILPINRKCKCVNRLGSSIAICTIYIFFHYFNRNCA